MEKNGGQTSLQAAFHGDSLSRGIRQHTPAPILQAEVEQAFGQFSMALRQKRMRSWSNALTSIIEQCIGAGCMRPASRIMSRRGKFQGSLREYDGTIATARDLNRVLEETDLLL